MAGTNVLGSPQLQEEVDQTFFLFQLDDDTVEFVHQLFKIFPRYKNLDFVRDFVNESAFYITCFVAMYYEIQRAIRTL